MRDSVQRLLIAMGADVAPRFSAGRILAVEQVATYSYRVVYRAAGGTDELELFSIGARPFGPLEGETIQVLTTHLGEYVWVSGRRFIQHQPRPRTRPTFDEYSRVHVPADPRRLG
jgi:hypothetical protein